MENGPPKADKLFDQQKAAARAQRGKLFDQQKQQRETLTIQRQNRSVVQGIGTTGQDLVEA